MGVVVLRAHWRCTHSSGVAKVNEIHRLSGACAHGGSGTGFFFDTSYLQKKVADSMIMIQVMSKQVMVFPHTACV